jgi:hypothetical protein
MRQEGMDHHEDIDADKEGSMIAAVFSGPGDPRVEEIETPDPAFRAAVCTWRGPRLSRRDDKTVHRGYAREGER